MTDDIVSVPMTRMMLSKMIDMFIALREFSEAGNTKATPDAVEACNFMIDHLSHVLTVDISRRD